ncbi:MAG: tyrosine-type recombinase/integrase [Candidatus Limosilactobacillus merdavium]|uniref:Tyrosine-type recombinase/integrase n=1 Tax=Candidatus Limosilactobacillus merdavium TaxID=2838651 RepID=A0A9E2KUV9_9LACO|nr:tyrosine-type recombinase/integrase [Candidatus Limosilactobacillus merdavium]
MEGHAARTIPTSGAVNKTLKAALTSLDIHKQNFHFHSLRHSHVALLLANSVDIYIFSKCLGHSKISTTIDTYSYFILNTVIDTQLVPKVTILCNFRHF